LETVSWPAPEPGLVVRYSYLWKSDHDDGQEEGSKDRPCAIVLSVSTSPGAPTVTVLPITHVAPKGDMRAVEIPQVVKVRLGLDHDRSWIVLTEGNVFKWPGPDLRPLPKQNLQTIAYGYLPPRLFADVYDQFIALIKDGIANRVQRTE
jgi:hypothetical protein